MADHTKIEWTDATWQIVTGCSVVSPGCTNCYAMRLAGTRLRNHPSRAGLTKDTKAGPVWTGETRFNAQWLDQPLRWKTPRMIFVAAHGDLFADGVTDEQLDQIFAVMALSPQHIFQVLTKRPERMRDYLLEMQRSFESDYLEFSRRWGTAAAEVTESPCASGAIEDIEFPLPNAWLGVSVEDQRRSDERIPFLLDTPAAIRWISAEPLLGTIDLRAFLPDTWKCKQPVRDWADFVWPSWVPEGVRKDIESFWNPEWGRGPNAWMRGAIENGQPLLGTTGQYETFRCGEPLIEGRFVPAWNNIGRVITDAGEVHCVSAGIYQSRPPRINWVVAGGESGWNARPMHPDWARLLRDQCAEVGVPFLFKQWGNWQVACEANGHIDHDMLRNDAFWIDVDSTRHKPSALGLKRPYAMHRVSKAVAGRTLDGVEHNGFPPLPAHFKEHADA
ncbi:phage Gp37/Gp68 family protein [Rhizobium sp. BK602]|uniref:phage Gp37/Gp68 family protein n=1 Tax=Rhizobium sp. BK602 TaxID=2586986 RepID=UPI001608A30F|nr:phage Gp37/Gp68 family protein [Rhizobium sp. BK602]MBB3608623.1 protein gp37 [Rhizobium sp. BK602]